MRDAKIIHVVARREISDPPTQLRVRNACESWAYLYSGGMLHRHLWTYKRNARDIGEQRDLPYLLDVIKYGMEAATRKDDIILFTNDDIILHPLVPSEVERHAALFEAGSGRRVDIDTRKNPMAMPPLYSNPVDFIELSWPHVGRDAFLFTRGWLERYMHMVPDFVLGAWGWDICVAVMLRILRGIPVEKLNSLYDTVMGCELPDGIIIHEAHESKWQEGGWQNRPANKHNRDLFLKWQEKYAPHITVEKVDQQDYDKSASIRYTKFWTDRKMKLDEMCRGVGHTV